MLKLKLPKLKEIEIKRTQKENNKAEKKLETLTPVNKLEI